MARCETFAAVNSMADPFGQAAMQAPQPMHSAASMAVSASFFDIRMALPSGTPPVWTEMYPPDWMILSMALRSTIRSLITGKARARNGSIYMVSPSLKLRIWSWQTVVFSCGPWGDAVHDLAAHAADALAAVAVERDRVVALFDQALVHAVQHLQEGHVREMSRGLVLDESALVFGPSGARRKESDS